MFSHVDYLDNDGVDLDTAIKINVNVKIDDDEIYLDFTGTNKQVKAHLT